MTSPSYCGAPSLLARSYPIPPRWPFPRNVRLVMETVPSTCDFYANNPKFCGQFAADRTFEPEYHVREAIASFLVDCHRRRCDAVDLGANNGWFSALMLSLGAHVVSAEPQGDFAAAINETAALNCWSARSVVHNAFVVAGSSGGELRPITRANWRAGSRLSRPHLAQLAGYLRHSIAWHDMA